MSPVNKGKPKITIGGLSKRYLKMVPLYAIFANDWVDCLDFSDQAKIDLFNHESYGTSVRPNNGYAIGKKWLNVHVSMWKEDISSGLLWRKELYDDPKFPHWWLDSIFKDF